MPREEKEQGAEKAARTEKRQRDGFLHAISLLSHFAVTIIACIIIGILLGRFLDNLLGTAPWLLLVFILLGVAAAFKSIFDISRKM